MFCMLRSTIGNIMSFWQDSKETLSFPEGIEIGVYGVLSDGNNIAPQATWKVSFAVLDDRNMKWNF